MTDVLAGTFLLIVGFLLIWIGLFRFDWIYKGFKELDKGKIGLLPTCIEKYLDYWFYKIVIISMGLLLIFLVGFGEIEWLRS